MTVSIRSKSPVDILKTGLLYKNTFCPPLSFYHRFNTYTLIVVEHKEIYLSSPVQCQATMGSLYTAGR